MSRVLVACEYSGTVRDVWLAAGHEAMSCDLLPTDVPGPHYQGDVRDVLLDGWDILIAHPPCTFLTCSAEWAYKDVQTKNIRPGTLIGAARRAAREEALDFVRLLLDLPSPTPFSDIPWTPHGIPRIALENPVGVISTRIRPASQYIQPHDFGHDASKKTGFWLQGLPPLKGTKYIEPRLICCGIEVPLAAGKYGCPNCCGENVAKPRWANQTDSGQNRLPPSADRWKVRSETYQGIAEAMVEQWDLTGGMS